MATEITSKSELAALAIKLDSKSKEVIEAMNNLSATLKTVESYDGIDVAATASTLSSNLTNLSTDLTNVSLNISNYAGLIEEFDSDDFDMGDTSSTNDATVTLSPSTNTESQDTSSNQSNSNNVISSGVTAGVVTNTHTNTSSNSAGKHYGSNNSNTSSGGGKINASGPVKITEGDPNNPDIDITKYSNYPEKGFNVTTGNLCYELSEKDFELLCAIVSAESDKTYDDALAVVTTILNRCETDNWIRSHGTDPIAQATAPNQFVVYQHGSYRVYMEGRAPDTVVQAVKDALAGVRNHKYLSFRSNGTFSYSDNMISKTGNRYK